MTKRAIARLNITLCVVYKKVYNQNEIADAYRYICLHRSMGTEIGISKEKKEEYNNLPNDDNNTYCIGSVAFAFPWNAQYVPTVRGRSTRV